jgi:hypothetical protein
MSSTSTIPDPSIPTHTDSSNNNGGGTVDFFGFVVAFVALLLVFVVCGLASRRRFVARQRAILADPWAFVAPVRQKEPKYWELSVAPGGSYWRATMVSSV